MKDLPTKTWCPQILTGISLQSDGLAPCCEFNSPRIKANTIQDYKQSATYKKLLQNMQDGEWHPGCIRCKEREANGQRSQRLKEVKNQAALLNMHDVESIDFQKFYDVHNNDQYLWVNLQPSNKCNQACVMCWTGSSSKLEEEVRENPNTHWLKMIPTFHQYNDISDLASHRHPKGRIYLSGGEPSIMKDVIKYLDSIPNPEEVQIDFNSNFQSWNPKFWEILSRFKRLYIMASIDAVGEAAEYHRYLSNWNIVESNVLQVKDMLPQAHLKISPTWTMLNIWKLGDLASWCEKHELNSSIANVALNKHFSITQIHGDYKQKLKDIFDKSYFARDENIKGQFNSLHSTVDASSFSKTNFEALCSYVENIDMIRGTDYKKVFPELYDYICDVKTKLTYDEKSAII